jgi:DNA (cytosine-5)-methyltransferase 1
VITVREAARLHGFPDWFAFHTTRWHGFRQVGNAVPPPLAHAVAGSVVAAAGISLPPRRSDSLELGLEELLRMPMVEAAKYYELPMSMLPQNVRAAQSRTDKKAA